MDESLELSADYDQHVLNCKVFVSAMRALAIKYYEQTGGPALGFFVDSSVYINIRRELSTRGLCTSFGFVPVLCLDVGGDMRLRAFMSYSRL